MKALIQRVRRGRVTVDGETTGAIDRGFVILLGVRHGDESGDAEVLAKKTANLRVFPDSEKRMNLSLTDAEGSALVISQFTLYADMRKGNRPSFMGAADPEIAEQHYEHYVSCLRVHLGPERVATGRFGAMMQVEIVNDGPVTIELHTDGKRADS